MVALSQSRTTPAREPASLDALLAQVESGDEVAETIFIARVRMERGRFVAGLESWLDAMGRRPAEAPIPPRHGAEGIHELAAALRRWPTASARLRPLLLQARRETQRDKHLDKLTRAVPHW